MKEARDNTFAICSHFKRKKEKIDCEQNIQICISRYAMYTLNTNVLQGRNLIGTLTTHRQQSWTPINHF